MLSYFCFINRATTTEDEHQPLAYFCYNIFDLIRGHFNFSLILVWKVLINPGNWFVNKVPFVLMDSDWWSMIHSNESFCLESLTHSGDLVCPKQYSFSYAVVKSNS